MSSESLVYHLLLLHGILISRIFGGTEWGFKNYTKYEPGDMSVILTAPHGGALRPSTQSNGDPWPDRKDGCKRGDGECIWTQTCGVTSADCDAKTLNDLNTATVARDIANGIETITGFRPHVVYNNLHRSKLDANREINESTLNVPDAITAYHNYTNFINKAKSAISGRGLLLDVHGHGHTLQRTELGYLISGSNLDSGNYDASGSSIKSLVEHRCKGDRACFKEFIHGNRSLGHFMNQEDVQAVPSPQNKTPDGNSYFSGGYTVKTYGSRDGGNIDAIQMEFPRSLRTGWNNDTKYELARAIASFFDLNYDIHEATTQSPTSSPTKRSRTTKRTGTTPSKGNITVIQQNNTCVARVLFGMSIIVLSFLFKLS